MAIPHYGRHHFTRMLACITFLHMAYSEEEDRRPFFIIGHMANSLSDADMLMTKGANSLEVDVRFTSNGTASRVYHGFPCDCLRKCDGETPFTEYLDYIRGVSSVVSDTSALNVLLYVSSTDDSELFRGALDTLSNLEEAEHWIELVGFDFGTYRHPEDISEAFAQLDISGHRWQGGGITNCLVDFLGNFQLPEIVANRDGNGYVDKAYAWTVDDNPTITRFIKLGIDGMITNRPDNVLKVINNSDIAPLVRPAGPEDSPWNRIPAE
ncbi:dermonecrotic toxin SPH isoform X3 [Dermacentor silvarum]|uniref:dermonecrotic toxin SPH isoform X3 n=1 Tax=Dermacentor silvarum TaxID=543639 RepID=UPI002101AC62|nr:dermonecrotic toxin SPH isoform X3 [Dermacentor silvarum]